MGECKKDKKTQKIECIEKDFTEIKCMLARITKAIEGDSSIGQEGLASRIDKVDKRLTELEVLRIRNSMMIKIVMYVGCAISTLIGSIILVMVSEIVKRK